MSLSKCFQNAACSMLTLQLTYKAYFIPLFCTFTHFYYFNDINVFFWRLWLPFNFKILQRWKIFKQIVLQINQMSSFFIITMAGLQEPHILNDPAFFKQSVKYITRTSSFYLIFTLKIWSRMKKAKFWVEQSNLWSFAQMENWGKIEAENDTKILILLLK